MPQCHNHPFAKWKREQFWQLAAFFAGVDRPANGRIGDDTRLAELKIPGLGKVVQARFLDESAPKLTGDRKPREALANWMTAADNAYFARAAVNRIWAHFFGTGIVDPIDDFDESNPPSHPQLLDALGRRIRAAKVRREIPDPRDLRQPPLSVVEPAN